MLMAVLSRYRPVSVSLERLTARRSNLGGTQATKSESYVEEPSYIDRGTAVEARTEGFMLALFPGRAHPIVISNDALISRFFTHLSAVS